MVKDRSRLLRRQAMFWGIAAAVVLAFIWLFSSILLPFVLGMVLAYFLDPIAVSYTHLTLPTILLV